MVRNAVSALFLIPLSLLAQSVEKRGVDRVELSPFVQIGSEMSVGDDGMGNSFRTAVSLEQSFWFSTAWGVGIRSGYACNRVGLQRVQFAHSGDRLQPFTIHECTFGIVGEHEFQSRRNGRVVPFQFSLDGALATWRHAYRDSLGNYWRDSARQGPSVHGRIQIETGMQRTVSPQFRYNILWGVGVACFILEESLIPWPTVGVRIQPIVSLKR